MTPIEQQVQRLNRKVDRLAKTETQRATSSALNSTVRHIKSRIVKDVSHKVSAPQKLIRKRVYIKRSKANTQFARITVYPRDISAIGLGSARTLTRTRKGQRLVSGVSRGAGGRFTKRQHSGNTSIRVGNRTYRNAFINQIRGNWHVMQRKGEAKYPVDVLKIPAGKPLANAAATMPRRLFRAEYEKKLRQEYNYRAQKLSQSK